MSDNAALQNLVHTWQRDLHKIIARWNLIPGAPKDGFSSLSHKLIAHLTRDAVPAKIVDVLRSELIVRYGLSPTEIELAQFASQVMDWWDSKR